MRWAQAVLAAFAASPGAGVVSIDEKMIDKAHLRAAERILDRAARVGGTGALPPRFETKETP